MLVVRRKEADTGRGRLNVDLHGAQAESAWPVNAAKVPQERIAKWHHANEPLSLSTARTAA
jgi:hypothetical protein